MRGQNHFKINMLGFACVVTSSFGGELITSG